MADTNPFPRTVASITREGHGPQHHPCNDPSLGPLEFLHAVYCDPLLPMSIRIDAARGLLPYTEPRPANIPSLHIGCTIVIGGLGPCTTEPEPRSPADPTKNHSENLLSAGKTLTRDGEPGDPENTEMNSNPLPFPDYSIPPTHTELQEIKAAINRLRPDLAHLPIPEPHLCQCGHWIFGPCPLAERCRDKSSPNGDKSTLN